VGTVTTAGSALLMLTIGLAYIFGIKSVLITVIIFPYKFYDPSPACTTGVMYTGLELDATQAT
jgi:hypothetical protein